MISIIVPVYNVEPYLRKCLDSILGQTYQDIEVLVIDDGSTDGSGAICDEYKKKSKRVKVFHIENRGLSYARNLGLDEAKGEWIGFVDSDDWIEPDMYEVLIRKAENTGADIIECSVFVECISKTVESKINNALIWGSEAVQALLHNKLSNGVWDKLWRSEVLRDIRFPEGHINEDVATIYKILPKANLIQTIDIALYHYLRRPESLSRTHTMDYLVDYWIANNERYQTLVNNVDEYSKNVLLCGCAAAAGRTWAYYCENNDQNRYQKEIAEINEFVRTQIPLFGKPQWDMKIRVGVLFPHFKNWVSFRIAWLINRVSRRE